MREPGSPLLTLGLLVFNGEKFLEETLESILTQSFTDFELIISDNASTDVTETICRSFAARDERIRYVRQVQNISAIGNFNYLLGLANSRYFKWCAADDLIKPGFLASCIAFLEEFPDFVLCHTRTITMDGSGRTLPNDIIRSSGAAEPVRLEMPESISTWQRYRAVLLGNTAVMDIWGVFRTEVLRSAGTFEPYIGYEKVLMSNVSLRGRIGELPNLLFAYRVHSKQFSSQTSPTAQRSWSGLKTGKRRYPRFQYLKGYIRGVARSEQTLNAKLMCYAAIFTYLFQVRKWRQILYTFIHGADFGAGNAEIIQTSAVDAGPSMGRRKEEPNVQQ